MCSQSTNQDTTTDTLSSSSSINHAEIIDIDALDNEPHTTNGYQHHHHNNSNNNEDNDIIVVYQYVL